MTAGVCVSLSGANPADPIEKFWKNPLEQKLELLGHPKLLVINEIGYLQLDRAGANLFSQLITRRYEHGYISDHLQSESGELG